MRGASDEAEWWRRTGVAAAAFVIVTGGLCLLPVLLPSPFEGLAFLGLSLPTFLAIVAAPLVALAATFLFAARQLARDRRYDVTGS